MPVRARVAAREVRLGAAVEVAVDPASGALTTRLRDVRVALDGFDLDGRGLAGLVDWAVERTVRRRLVAAARDRLERDVPPALAAALGAAALRRRARGRVVTVALRPEAVSVTPAGLSLTAAADVTAPPAAGAPASPGSLWGGPRPAPALAPGRDVAVALDVALLNRAAHAAWQAGLLETTLTPADTAGWNLPVALPLDGFLLASLFPALAPPVDPAEPVEVEAAPRLPAVVRTRPAPGLLRLEQGELVLSFFAAPPGRPRRLLLRVAAQVRADVAARLDPGPALAVAVEGRPEVLLDAVEAPLAPVSLIALEDVVDMLVPEVLRRQAAAWSAIALPWPAAATPPPASVDLGRDAAAPRFLTLAGDLR